MIVNLRIKHALKINVLLFRATILQHETSKVGKISTESVAKPAIMRAGNDGEYKKNFVLTCVQIF